MKPVLLALLLTSAVSSSAFAEKVVLIGDDDYAPYSYIEGGQFKGIYVDLLKQAAAKLAPAYQVELQPRPWKRGLVELETGAAVGLFPPYLKKERAYVQPYSVAMFRETVVLFCNDDVMKTSRKKFPEDFKGLTIGLNTGFSLSESLKDAAKAGTVTLSETKGNDANLRKLATKRVGCYAQDRGATAYSLKALKNDPDFAGFKLQEAVELSGEDAFIGYSAANKAAYKADFIAKMDAALKEVLAAGAINKIMASYK